MSKTSKELKDLKEKSPEELRKILKEARESLRELRFKIANKQLKNVRFFRKTKKNIAQMLTISRINGGKQ